MVDGYQYFVTGDLLHANLPAGKGRGTEAQRRKGVDDYVAEHTNSKYPNP